MDYHQDSKYLDSDGEDYGYDYDWDVTPIEGTHLCHVEYVCSICGIREDNPWPLIETVFR